jgi:HAD superfamily hydrolase (TIGR01490 family)
LALAIFYLDETRLSADSDHAWGEYVVDNDLVDKEVHRKCNQQFYDDYKSGQLDIDAYMRFSCQVLSSIEPDVLFYHRERFIKQRILPLLQPKAQQLVDSHKELGDLVIVVTATIEFITEPIVKMMGIEHLIAPIPQKLAGRYTGEISGVPSFGAGKVTRLRQWLSNNEMTLTGSHFYSDSANDIPLLNLVDHPVAVDPDPTLEKLARQNQWPIISLRN